MNELPLPHRLRHSQRAKYLRLVLKPDAIELVIPNGVSEDRALQFLEQNRAWVIREVAARQARFPIPPPPALAQGPTVPFQGRDVPLLIREAPGRGIRIAYWEGFIVSLPPTTEGNGLDHAHAALRVWLKNWLRAEARRLAAVHGPGKGLVPRQFRIKTMRTRWGSCGPHYDINLNLVLAFAPPPQLEYVVVHELCHIRHRNHSAAFWSLVGEILPDYRERRHWLRLHGGELLRRFA